jgi:transposase InsO family protein
MPWKTATAMSQRLEFVTLAQHENANLAELCRRFGLSRQTGYKWLKRYQSGGNAALADLSRRPHSCPHRTADALTRQLLELRAQHPAWGPRKLQRRLQDLGVQDLPAPSTIATILRRNGCIDPAQSAAHQPWQRFEHARPNDLWQMDFKGHFALSRGGRCHPLTILDDHSRYLLALRACRGETGALTRPHLEQVFACYGLPERFLCDNSPPWSGCGGEWTALALWLVRLGIGLTHGRPYHPQTQGKDERFHRSLKAEVSSRTDLRDLPHSQHAFDQWRSIYNHERPHDALRLATPATRYAPSARALPSALPPIEYGPDALVFTVKTKGEITWQNRTYYFGHGFARQPIALYPTATDGVHAAYFCQQRLGYLDLHWPAAKSKNHYLPLRKTLHRDELAHAAAAAPIPQARPA